MKLLLVLLAIGLVAGTAQANLLLNPSFEDGVWGSGTPDYWAHYWIDYDAQHVWVNSADEAHTGDKFMEMFNWIPYGSNSDAYLGQEVLGVSEGEEYFFGVWAKTPAAGLTKTAEIYIDWYSTSSILTSSAAGWIDYEIVSVPVTGDTWTEVDFGALTAPEGAIAAVFWLAASTANDVDAIYYDDASMEIFCASNPNPNRGQVVDAASDVTLSWTNMDPNNPADSVYVDVWFGIDPELLAQVITAGENTTTVQVDASDLRRYYWQVDSYIYGDPAVVNYDISGTDPNFYPIFRGSIWNFTTDASPSVDAGIDMITWSGEPVQLDATVVDDGASALTYLWTADSVYGVSVEFSDPGIEAPTVTITKDFSVIPIVNPGFETPHPDVTYEGDYAWYDWDTSIPVSGWGKLNSSIDHGLWWVSSDPNNVDGYGYGGSAPEGNIIGMGWNDIGYSTDGGFTQVLADTLTADTTYTLTVEVGHNPYYGMDAGGYKVQLLAGGTVIAEDPGNLNIALDTFETSTVVYTYDEVADANKVGEHLEIRLLVPVTSREVGVDFDDGRLNVAPDRPVSSAVSTVTLTVAASDVTNPEPAVDSMTIDVYDDECKMARVGMRLTNPSDIDKNCIIGLGDVAAMAEKWLESPGLTEPVAKP